MRAGSPLVVPSVGLALVRRLQATKHGCIAALQATAQSNETNRASLNTLYLTVSGLRRAVQGGYEMRAPWLALAAIVAACGPLGVTGHGLLTYPPMRTALVNGNGATDCGHCLNSGGARAPLARG